MWPFQAGRWDGVCPLAEDEGNRVKEATASQQTHQALRHQNLPQGLGTEAGALSSQPGGVLLFTTGQRRSGLYTHMPGQQPPGTSVCYVGSRLGTLSLRLPKEYTVRQGKKNKNHSHTLGRGGITEQGLQDPDTKLGKDLQSGQHLVWPGIPWQRPLKAAPEGTQHLTSHRASDLLTHC